MNIRSAAIVVLLGLIMLSQYIRWSNEEVALTQVEHHNRPDTYMAGLTARYYRPDGGLKYQLNSPSAEFYRERDQVVILKPYMQFPTDDNIWHVFADDALVRDNQRYIDMNGRVTMARPPIGEQEGLTVLSRDALISSQDESIESGAITTVYGRAWQSKSIGFKALMPTNQLHQKQHIQDHYDAP